MDAKPSSNKRAGGWQPRPNCSASDERPAVRHLRSLGFVALLVSASVAQAQQDAPGALKAPVGFYYGGTEALSYDSNVTETNDAAGVIQGAWIANTSLIGGFNEIYGRQHLTGAATVGRVLYHGLSQYNYTAEDVHAGWTSNWPADINTDLDGGRTRQLAHFADFQTPVRNILTRDAINASLDAPVYGQDWRVLVGADGSKIRNSDPVETVNNANTREFVGGIRFQPVSGNKLDLLARVQHVSYPDALSATITTSAYTDHGADVRATWVFSPFSNITGRVGYIRRRVENPALQFENFSGPAYEITYVWLPTPKTTLTLYGLRQTGATGENASLYAITRTYRVTPAYLPTAKTKISLNLEYSKYDNISTPAYSQALTAYYASLGAAVPPPPPNDFTYKFKSVGLDGTWDPYRWLEAKLSWRRDQRTADAIVAPQFNYVERVTMLTVQAKF